MSDTVVDWAEELRAGRERAHERGLPLNDVATGYRLLCLTLIGHNTPCPLCTDNPGWCDVCGGGHELAPEHPNADVQPCWWCQQGECPVCDDGTICATGVGE